MTTLWDTTGTDVVKALAAERRAGGGVSTGLVLTLVCVADESQVEIPGEGDPIALDGITQYEFVRSRFGRRSRDQVAGYDWSAPVTDDMLSNWFAFGPSQLPIVEAASKWG